MTNEQAKAIAKANIISTAEVARMLHISRQYISLLVKQNKLVPFITTEAGRYYWWKEDVINYLTEKCESEINDLQKVLDECKL